MSRKEHTEGIHSYTVPGGHSLGVPERRHRLHLGSKPLLPPLIHRQQQLDGHQGTLQGAGDAHRRWLKQLRAESSS